jgi:transposase
VPGVAQAIVIRLRPEQRESLEQKRKTHPDPRVRRRAGIVVMSDDGWPVADICTAAGVTRATVANTRRRWLQGGFRSLADAPRPGRPAIADGEYLASLIDAVNTDPRTLGYAFGLWTAGRLAAHLHRRQRKSLSAECVGDHLRAMGYVWARPKHTLEGRRDEAAHKKAHLELLRLKRGRNAETRRSSSSASTKRASTSTRTWLGRGVAEDAS